MATTSSGTKNPDTDEKNIEKCSILTPNQTNSTEEKSPNELLQMSMEEFYRDRPILISNLPVTANEDDLNVLLGAYIAKSIEIIPGQRKALVVLESGNEIEQLLLDLQNTKFQDCVISVDRCETEKLLCCAHLPCDYTLQKFRALVSPFCTVKKCFLYRGQTTNDFKWYGVVEYSAALSQIASIRMELDWRSVEGHHVHCDFLDKSLSSYRKLNSKCLFVDNLPKDFTNTSEFRDIFSASSSPLYCQIVIKDGKSLGYGIIEYRSWQEAEKSERHLNGHKILDVPMRITYCIPGISAVTICARLMSKFDNPAETVCKPSLLPDPVHPCKELLCNPLVQRLASQHPTLMTKFEEALQKMHKTYVKQLTSNPEKPGLLGPAPVMPLSPLMTVTVQLGLFILLAFQFQLQAPSNQFFDVDLTDLMSKKVNNNQSEKPSLLGDPYASQSNIILQSLLSKLSPGKPSQSHAGSDVSSMLMSVSQNLQNIDVGGLMNIGQIAGQLGHEIGFSSVEVPPLMDMPLKNSKEGLLGAAPPEILGLVHRGQVPKKSLFSNQSSPEGDVKQSLLGEPPQNLIQNWASKPKSGGLLPNPDAAHSHQIKSQGGKREHDEYDQYYGYRRGGTPQEEGGYYSSNYQHPENAYEESYNYNQDQRYMDIAAKAAAYAAYNQPSYNYSSYSGQDESYSSGYGSVSGQEYDDSYSYSSTDYSYKGHTIEAPPTQYSTAPPTNSGYEQLHPPGTSTMERPPYPTKDYHHPMSTPSYNEPIQPPSKSSQPLLKTPQGQKRSLSQLLPPPEPSPDGDYVGQHSQGIGGHYATSYANKRQKVSHTRLMMQY
ncbi:ribonucleoprotein PTB-binding 1-like [Ostrea edulis]|uniref:ribonucleoprotein PTB-binding 1-like n=1 Tax=Ostrea edulis TaxID=37623 RepID=UPI0024AFC2B7|nr:ribonucleoprotein PTB-binding 1-like [Ostrea edulis]